MSEKRRQASGCQECKYSKRRKLQGAAKVIRNIESAFPIQSAQLNNNEQSLGSGSVDWTEPWIILLLVFHGFITVLAVVTRNHGNIQAVLFCLLLLMVYFSEVLNEWAARNWRLFARDQYFDSSGVFISIMFAAPSLLNCLFLVCQWLWISGTLLIKAKQAQLRSQVQQQHADGSSQQVRGSDRTYRRDTSDFSGREKCD